MGIPTLSVVVPIYNEEKCLPELVARLAALREQVLGEFEINVILIDDGSTDQSRGMLKALSLTHEWINVRLLLRNFGHQIAVTAGMDVTTSDFVAVIDGDLQDPPELIPAMIRQLVNNGDHIVYGQRTVRQGESAFKLWSARLFYKLIRHSSKLDIPLDTGDFRVMSRRARDIISEMREHNRFLRGMAPWTGLKSSPFLYSRDERFAGSTKYSLPAMVNLAFNAIVSFSTTPLRALQLLGAALATFGSIGFAAFLLIALFGTGPVTFGLLASLNVISTGVVVGAIGIVGGYVHRIQDEVRGRPLYLVEEN
jgi:glycosyltransferase involved in cell wall biosynthesis